MLPNWYIHANLIGFGRAPGNTASFNATIYNIGVFPSPVGQLAVYDAIPSQPGAHLLLSATLPDIAVGGYVELTGTLNLAGLPAAINGLQSIYVMTDPAGAVAELNENNNLLMAGSLNVATPSRYRAICR